MTSSAKSSAGKPVREKTVLITGVSGLLGLNLAVSLQHQARIVGVCHQTHLYNAPFELYPADLSDTHQLEDVLNAVQPDVLINCAALANLDRCEEQPDLAHRINAEMPGWLARWTSQTGSYLIQISTDAVFDGAVGNYRETDATHPLSCYAMTKLEGEQRVLAEDHQALVCRVNFYGFSTSGARSLVEWFYRNLAAGNTVNGFTDVFFCPLFVMDLADILWQVVQLHLSGLYHVVSSECLSKYDFGRHVARIFGFDEHLIQPTSWKEAGLKAVRSPNLCLCVEKIQKALGKLMPDQNNGLEGLKKQAEAGYPEWIKNFVKRV